MPPTARSGPTRRRLRFAQFPSSALLNSWPETRFAPAANPSAATELAEQRWTFEPNDGAFAWFEFDFGDEDARLQLEDVDGPIDVLVGLDGVPRMADAWGNRWAFTGEWTDNDTFLIKWQIIGGAARGTFEFSFDEDGIVMVFNVVTSGSTTSAVALSN